MASGPVARLSGLIPPGRADVAPIEVSPGQVWTIGRRDAAALTADPDRAARHLAVPGARPDLSVHQLELRVGRLAVSLSAARGAGVVVDGSVRSGPVVLTAGTSHVSPSLAGVEVDFAVTVLVADDFAQAAISPAPTGTTVRLVLQLESGSSLWRTAHALAWPSLPTRRRPHALGWSGRDVAARLAQLGWADDARATTALAQQLHTLADRVAQCRLADGRPAASVLPEWPPWATTDEDETRDQRAERRNRCVADVLWRASTVGPDAIDG